jgi:hypothetical protein
LSVGFWKLDANRLFQKFTAQETTFSWSVANDIAMQIVYLDISRFFQIYFYSPVTETCNWIRLLTNLRPSELAGLFLLTLSFALLITPYCISTSFPTSHRFHFRRRFVLSLHYSLHCGLSSSCLFAIHSHSLFGLVYTGGFASYSPL